MDASNLSASSRQESTPEVSRDLSSPSLYLNRELTWLSFNRRVLSEAQDREHRLLERLKFLAITASNLDEFFMKRIGGLKQQLADDVAHISVDGRTPAEQIEECLREIDDFEARQQTLLRRLIEELSHEHVRVLRYKELSDEEKTSLRAYYLDNVFPLVTPHAMSPAHPFPFISNLSINLLVTLRHPGDDETSLARVKVPLGGDISRIVKIRASKSQDPLREHSIVFLEDVVANNLDLLFPNMILEACETFRVIRNANTETDEEDADDLLVMIQSELRHRKVAPIVRLEVAEGMSDAHRAMLAEELNLDTYADVKAVEGMLGLRDLMDLAALGIPELRDPPHHPVGHPKLRDARSVCQAIREHGPIFLHHPYESFDGSVMRMLSEAAEDPKVRAIKMTLYRSTHEVIRTLLEAARNGKQVTVVVELKARFDEARNIRWVQHLEEHGINVTYGVVGLKTHSKLLLIIRRDADGLRRYCHIGTGNYHPANAKLYSDFGLLTADPIVGRDMTELFNYLTTGYEPNRNYRKLLVAPTDLKSALIQKIEREAEKTLQGKRGHIQFKINALEDRDVVEALYRASQAGV
ncbi:MAG: polyphosphate kinase 1, partial [Myxococcota bacterium]